MPPIEEQNTAEAEKDAQVQPETGADHTPAQQLNEPASKPEDSSDNELAKWKAMSRKNEKQAEANLKQMQQFQAELAQAKADNARLTVKNTYPQITDEALSLCSETEPDKIADWAERYARLNPINSEPSKPTPLVMHDQGALKTAMLAENPQGAVNPKPKRGDAYERSMKRQKARQRNHNQ